MDDQVTAPVARRVLLAGLVGTGAAWVAQLIAASPADARTRPDGAGAKVPLAEGDALRVGLAASGTSTTQVIAASSRSDVSGILANGATGVDGRVNGGSDGNAGVYGVGGTPAYGVLSNGRLGTSGTLEVRKQTSGVGSVPAGKVYIYLREQPGGGLGLVARFPDGVERSL